MLGSGTLGTVLTAYCYGYIGCGRKSFRLFQICPQSHHTVPTPPPFQSSTYHNVPGVHCSDLTSLCLNPPSGFSTNFHSGQALRSSPTASPEAAAQTPSPCAPQADAAFPGPPPGSAYSAARDHARTGLLHARHRLARPARRHLGSGRRAAGGGGGSDAGPGAGHRTAVASQDHGLIPDSGWRVPNPSSRFPALSPR